ncbi:Monooxygenase involved in coenzyme Q (ubiquinone) biosynthesis [Handroanthus impetiginosus]|uniref:Monooxygenase involved in coenzyme Q (Ubiquinone) biosynthesis n=1 Tax=Handroanthus impetiginosus TaxID=429701 RepID=A0A2G9I8N8_9LAMI|nr:Monooxygenase involved in coenzyme Q (ubiquinone) biosynthesis [Handroanthus impetiginosus]
MGFLRLTTRFCGLYRTRTRNNGLLCNYHIQRRLLSGYCEKIDGEDSLLPVLIVGAGPVGLVLSILLTKLGVKCAVVEKSNAFSRHPQAHFINNRSMEVFRKINGLANEILRYQPPVDLWRKFIYCTSLAGPVLGSVDHMQPKDFDRIVSPVSVAHFSQYKLMRLLIKQLEDIGFHVRSDGLMNSDVCKLPEQEILLGHECTSISASKDGVTVTTCSTREGKNVAKDFHCSFVVGTDGAGSTVRKLMGIGMNGEKDLQKLISVHFMSQELGQYLINQRPGMLFFVFNTKAIGVIVAHDLMQGEFVLQVPFYPPQQKFEDFGSGMCEKLIFKLVGRELADINVLDVKPWVMHAEVAETFLACNSRIILAGDAAHRFPPAGGFGMNTGIQDAHNLAWKLASVLKGIAPPSIVSTYEMERRQIALFNTALSVENFKAAMAVPAALGLDPKVANSVYHTINDTFGSILPSDLQRAILDGIFSIGRMQLSDSLLNENNPLGSSRLSKLKQIFEEGKSLQLQFPAEDLGFRYSKGALMSDGDGSSGAQETPTGRRRDYVPSSDPGSRLPHMNIQLLSNLSSKDAFSTLDLVSVDNIEFLLIIAPITGSYQLAQAAFKVAEELKLPLKVCVMWQKNTTDETCSSETVLQPWKNFIDVIEVKNSPTSPSWWDLCRMTNRGAILVRPDEHIAWRTKSEIKNDPLVVLKKVFCAVLGLESSNR